MKGKQKFPFYFSVDDIEGRLHFLAIKIDKHLGFKDVTSHVSFGSSVVCS